MQAAVSLLGALTINYAVEGRLWKYRIYHELSGG